MVHRGARAVKKKITRRALRTKRIKALQIVADRAATSKLIFTSEHSVLSRKKQEGMVMQKDTSNEDLKKVMREAGDLLEQLDEKHGKTAPSSQLPGIKTNQDAAPQKNPQTKSVSKEMLVRLEAIDKLASQGYQIKKIWDAIPTLSSSSGIDRSVLVSSPAGFSWIAFFFPYAVFTQIKEWSYFYVAGSTYLAGSILYKITGRDPTFILGLAVSYQYGFYFPYLRWLAIQNKSPELDKASSIVLGLLLSFACILPSLIFEAIFIGG